MRRRLNRWWEKRERGVRPLTAIYAPNYVRVWLAFDSKGFDLEEVSEDSVGLDAPPEWYGRDVLESGWDHILGVYNCWPDGWSRELDWMLKHGIAPGQPFLVHMATPHWHKCSYEYEEYDCEFDWEILRVAPLRRPSNLADRLERAVQDEKVFRSGMKKRQEALRIAQRMAVQSMYLKLDVYFAPGQRPSDDMEMPSGVRFILCSDAALPKERPSYAQLVSGEDHNGDHKKAMDALVEKALKELPGLTEERIRSMPRRNW